MIFVVNRGVVKFFAMLKNFYFPISYLLLFPVFMVPINWQFLLFYMIPWASRFILPVFPFLILPIFLAFCSTGLWYNKFTTKKHGKGWLLIGVNLVFLVALLIFGEIYKNALIFQEAANKPHDCLHIHTFLNSLHGYGEIVKTSHAIMMVGGTPYYWSYIERKFLPGASNPWLKCPMTTFDFGQ